MGLARWMVVVALLGACSRLNPGFEGDDASSGATSVASGTSLTTPARTG